MIVDYLGEQFIIELKIWNSSTYIKKGEKQLCEYLEHFGLETRYMLKFNFNQKIEQSIKNVTIGLMTLHEATL